MGTGDFNPIGMTDLVVLNESGTVAYPVVDGVPVLVAPEALAAPGSTEARNVNIGVYAEAYLESRLYSRNASDARVAVDQLEEVKTLRRILETDPKPGSFPVPAEFWLRAGSTIGAQKRVFRHLAPKREHVGMQLGGWGYYALLLLAAGAERAYAVSPFVSELQLGQAAAEYLGLSERFVPVAAFAEELPFVDGAVDRIYSPGSIHHTQTQAAFPEVARVLSQEGRFASLDVWKAPLHGIGTKVFGKCNGNIHCQPLDSERIAPVHSHFRVSSVEYHGAVARYPLAIAERIRRTPSVKASERLADLEERWAARSKFVRRQSSVVTICAENA